MAQTYDEIVKTCVSNLENRARAVNCLRYLVEVKKQRPYKLIASAEAMEDRPKKVISADTLKTMLEPGYNLEGMSLNTFHCLVWLLQINNSWDHQDYQVSLKETAYKFGFVFRRFADPLFPDNQTMIDRLVGNYQGYRWSIAKPGSLILFSLSVTYNKQSNALITEETVIDDAPNTKEVFEGSIAFHHANQKFFYIVSRIKKSDEIMGIQSAIIHNYDYDERYGNVNRMKGVVFSHFTRPYVSSVVFYRDPSPETKFLIPDEEFDPILRDLNSIAVDIAGPLAILAPEIPATSR